MKFIELLGQITVDHIELHATAYARNEGPDLPALGRYQLTRVREWVLANPPKAGEAEHVTILRAECERFIHSCGTTHLN